MAVSFSARTRSALALKRIFPPRLSMFSSIRRMIACDPPRQYPALPQFIQAREMTIAMADILPMSPVEKNLFSSGSENRRPYSCPLILDSLPTSGNTGRSRNRFSQLSPGLRKVRAF